MRVFSFFFYVIVFLSNTCVPGSSCESCTCCVRVVDVAWAAQEVHDCCVSRPKFGLKINDIRSAVTQGCADAWGMNNMSIQCTTLSPFSLSPFSLQVEEHSNVDTYGGHTKWKIGTCSVRLLFAWNLYQWYEIVK